MKKIISYLLLAMVIVSCSKNESQLEPDYFGVYNSAHQDTAYVSQGNGSFVKIRFAAVGVGMKVVFDSVRVNTDLTFTWNQLSYWDGFGKQPSVGAGVFAKNTVHLQFSMNGAPMVIFDGVKK